MKVLMRKSWDTFDVEIVGLPCSTVEIVDWTVAPFDTVTKLVRGYKGIYSNDPVTSEEISKAFEDLYRTKLQTPFEMVYFTFLIRGVTRGFTHQLVRTRIGASFVQESMRFLGHQSVYRILYLGRKNEVTFDEYAETAYKTIQCYENSLNSGESSENARGIIPTNILTNVFFGVSLKTLQNMYAQRMCCQAQPGEWQVVMKQIKTILKDHYCQFGDLFGDLLLSAPFERGEPCGYRASFDRPCIWQKTK